MRFISLGAVAKLQGTLERVAHYHDLNKVLPFGNAMLTRLGDHSGKAGISGPAHRSSERRSKVFDTYGFIYSDGWYG